jgi:hypothetical protein
LDAEVDRVSEFIAKTAALLDGIGKQEYAENFLYAYEVAGVHAIHANRDGDESRVSQRLATSLFSTPFSTLYRQLLLKIQMASRMQAARGRR